MFVTRRHLSRRALLRGMGATVALPFLDAMMPACTALANTAAAPKPRMAFIYFPHGAVMSRWTPKTIGADYDLPPILEPLAPFRKRMSIVSGLENKAAIHPPVHALTPGTWLSCVSPRMSHDPFGGVTLDQLAAQHIGQDTPLPSLEVATEEEGGEGSCDRNYGCSYGKTISFRTPSTPLPMEHNPRKVFQQLFGLGDTPEERAAIARERKSMLDLMADEAKALERTLGPRDRAVLGDYLESVREIERRIQKVAASDLSSMKLPVAPGGVPSAFDEQLKLMFDLIALAYQANLTRVVSFMMAAEVSNQPYNHIGVTDAFHPLSHHQNAPAKLERLAKIQIYHSQVFAKFLTKLAAIPAGAGSVLDNSIVLYGSNMSDGNLHDHFPLPTAIIGGGCGRLKGNVHVRCPDHTPIANVHLTLLERAGIAADSFGDSQRMLSEI
jgi:Protein of unknown function (DUF1552)